ncbi:MULTISPECIES: class I SAM-dependent methyltransferase [Streptomyces]|uniref:Methyltransferase domain-containing protein n=1 Tax=Streptomyces dengpaensis TaxID=2049881 RepID=A0ABM6T3E7_9ACTN|nr:MULTISPECIES: methyltransferase domain-containing protein [Streptomyces]AVH61704.1 methyltransferase domain-containing protein [Streptomyces dengpaensis]
MTYGSDTYGDRTADEYDALYSDFVPPPAQIRLLAKLAGATPAVEIGSGTGRVTLPLAEHVPVLAVDASEEMTRQLAKKTATLPITPITADAAHYVAGQRVDLVCALFNTFFLLASETTQRAFLHNAARMLTDTGTLLIETFVPRPGQRLPDGPHPGVFPEGRSVVALKRRTVDTVVVFAAENHDDEQEFHYSEIVLRDGEPVRVLPGQMRYWRPEQIDALAGEAGLLLRERWEDWDRTPYDTDTSARHISLYRLAGQSQ